MNYATIQLAPMIATAVCPDMLVGRLYDRVAQRQHPGHAGHNLACIGGACFRTAFLILFVLSVFVRPRPPHSPTLFRHLYEVPDT